MSYGIEQWGIGGYGGADFIVTDHIPSDNATDISRLPIVSFVLASQSGNIVLNSINVTANGVALITNGVFTIEASGTIDSTFPAQVLVTAQVLHAFAPAELITIVVTALNASNQAPALGNTWQFTVNNVIQTFQTYVVRKFERIFVSQAAGPLTQPHNPQVTINLTPPTGFSGVVI